MMPPTQPLDLIGNAVSDFGSCRRDFRRHCCVSGKCHTFDRVDNNVSRRRIQHAAKCDGISDV
jgi:hypothetical protein